jgi:hypothetical protein
MRTLFVGSLVLPIVYRFLIGVGLRLPTIGEALAGDFVVFPRYEVMSARLANNRLELVFLLRIKFPMRVGANCESGKC